MNAPLPLRATNTGAVATIEPLDRLDDLLGPAWDALAQCAAEPNPFAERWFLGVAGRHLAPAGEVRVVVVRDGHELVGLLPITTEARYGRMPIRHVESWRHYHCFLGAPLVRRGCEAAFWDATLAALDRAGHAPNFLHLAALADDSPVTQALLQSRPGAAVVHRETRAMLRSDRSPGDYYDTTVRKKKRKEIARLRMRLAELGTVSCRRLTTGDDLDAWIDTFLRLEASGWKGRDGGAALSKALDTGDFARAALTGAWHAGRLEVRRLDLDDTAIAMLINFITPPGSFSFKIAFDEAYARFSPGVLISIDNLAILNRNDVAWMDSCAQPGHAMIEQLWGERRDLVRVTVPLAGVRRRATFEAARALENASAFVRTWR